MKKITLPREVIKSVADLLEKRGAAQDLVDALRRKASTKRATLSPSLVEEIERELWARADEFELYELARLRVWCSPSLQARGRTRYLLAEWEEPKEHYTWVALFPTRELAHEADYYNWVATH